MDTSTERLNTPTIYWINEDKLEEAKCLHAIATNDEPREFKGVKAMEVTALTEAAPALHQALLIVATSMNKHTAPAELVKVVSDALMVAKGE